MSSADADSFSLANMHCFSRFQCDTPRQGSAEAAKATRERTFPRFAESCSLLGEAAPYALVTGGGGISNRTMQSRIVANKSCVTAIPASWNVAYFECRITFAPILISFSRSVVNVHPR